MFDDFSLASCSALYIALCGFFLYAMLGSANVFSMRQGENGPGLRHVLLFEPEDSGSLLGFAAELGVVCDFEDECFKIAPLNLSIIGLVVVGLLGGCPNWGVHLGVSVDISVGGRVAVFCGGGG